MSKQETKIESIFNIPIEASLPDSDKNKENIDQMAFDKKLWNLGEVPFPDLSLKKESESKLSIDVPEVSNQGLKEYLNEDLLNAIDVSPMTTPKNIMNFDNNEINMDNKDLFQFSLYNNNKEEKETNIENDDKNDKDNKEDEINELKIIKMDEINKIKEDEGGGNINNNINNNIKKDNENNENIIKNINNETEINDKVNNNINNNYNINNINDNTYKKEEKKIEENKINIEEKSNNLKDDKKEKINLEKKEKEENKEKNKPSKKNYYQPQYQYPFIQFPYVTQPLMSSINSFGYENKFDGNKKYQILVPFTVLKKNIKTKKPFEIREGDWTCSNCNNLNFSFRVKCNRCYISKEQSELNKNKDTKKENKEQKYPQAKNKAYYQNNTQNTMQYKYYPGFIYVPIQAQYPKKEKK